MARVLGRAAVAVALVAVLASASLLLALAAAGVFATAAPAWSVSVQLAGIDVRMSVPGLARLATLPGVTHLLDGYAVRTRAGLLMFQRAGNALAIRCAPCRVQHEKLAPAPVELPGVELTIKRRGDALVGALAIDRVVIALNGRLHADRIDLVWNLPPTELATVITAMGDAIPEAGFARIEGVVRAHGTLSLPSRRGSATWSAEGFDVGGLGTEHLQAGWFRLACRQPDGQPRWLITGDGEPAWIAADRSGPYLAAALLAAEDQRFHQHGGYDEQALTELLAEFDDEWPRRGASTITQQLARTLYTGGERTLARKMRELLYAIEMERTLGKARILELYLNTVDWGPGLCGAKAAARAYFNKSPARLTAIEAAWLAGVLRNPHRAWEQQVQTRRPDRTRAEQVLMQMRDWPRGERRRWAAQPLAFAATAPAKSTTKRVPVSALATALQQAGP